MSHREREDGWEEGRREAEIFLEENMSQGNREIIKVLYDICVV